MAGPACEELNDPREPEHLRLRSEGLFRVEVGRTRPRVQFGQFGVADRRCKTQQQRRQESEPHGATRHGRAIERLLLECQPQKCSRGNERHGIDG